VTEQQPATRMERSRTDPNSAKARARAVGDELRQLHDWYRQELAALREQVGAYLDEPTTALGTGRAAPNLGRQLRERCLTFCDALGRHHTGEDTVVFPHLKERFPELDRALLRLRREHTVVERLRDDLQALLTRLGGDGSGDGTEPNHPEQLRADIERLTSELERHFNYEEEQLIPALNSLTVVPWPRPA
jgi:iron-sulfur cluster repair protein YtfE (RIC family)